MRRTATGRLECFLNVPGALSRGNLFSLLFLDSTLSFDSYRNLKRYT